MLVFSHFLLLYFFFFKQKTAYEMRISDWSSDVCSSDLHGGHGAVQPAHPVLAFEILEPRVEARRNSHPALDESGGGERAALARHAGCRRDAGAAMIGAMIETAAAGRVGGAGVIL